MAGTQKGKEIRHYFLECERIAKQATQVIPAQAQEIERLKLELELAKTQERLMQTTNAIATLHGSGMVALILGKPDAVVERVTQVEKPSSATSAVNQSKLIGGCPKQSWRNGTG